MSRKTLDPKAFQDACASIPELTIQEIEAVLRPARVKLVQPLNADHVFRLNSAFREYVMARLADAAISQSRKRLQCGTLEEQARMRKRRHTRIDYETVSYTPGCQTVIRHEYAGAVSHNRHDGDPDRTTLFYAIVSIYIEVTQRKPRVSRGTYGDPAGPCFRFVESVIRAYMSCMPESIRPYLPNLTPEVIRDGIRSSHSRRVYSVVSRVNAIERIMNELEDI